jgi:rare lipoprotein A
MRAERLSIHACCRMGFRCVSLGLTRQTALRAAGAPMLAGLIVALVGCSTQPMQTAATSSSEYFPESIYGPASPRVIAYGRIPHGGGQYLVGRPYVVAGRLYVPHVMNQSYSEVGMASWYGDAFHGRRTANGEIYDKDGITAAHPTMPLPSYARVTNLYNGRSIIVRVNDRGPYHSGRVMDVSSRVADLLDFKRFGTARIRVDYVGPASLGGSSDQALLGTLRTDGQPAEFAGSPDAMASAGAVPSLPFVSLFRSARAAVADVRPRRRKETSAIEQTTTADNTPATIKTDFTPSPPHRPEQAGSLSGGENSSASGRRSRRAADDYPTDGSRPPKKPRDDAYGALSVRRPSPSIEYDPGQ